MSPIARAGSGHWSHDKLAVPVQGALGFWLKNATAIA